MTKFRKLVLAAVLAALSLGAFGQNPVNGAMSNPIPNEGTTGTTINRLVKLTGNPSTAVLPATTDTNGVAGVCAAGCGTTGNAYVATWGLQLCAFDGATTAGDYAQISATTAGDCRDAGATYPTSGQVIGRVLSTNATAGSYLIDLFGPGIVAAAGGGGAAWGSITGILSDQTDLQSALDAKVSVTRAVAGHALSADVTIACADLSTAGDACAKNTGTAAGTLAAGDDSRIVGAVQTSRTVAGHPLSADVAIASTDLTDSANLVRTTAAATFGAFLYDFASSSFKPAKTTVAGLGTASTKSGYAYVVTDGTSASDCSTGGGSTYVNCVSNGTTWVAVGGGGGTGTVTHTVGSLTLNCVVVGNGSADLKCSPDATDDGSTFTVTGSGGIVATSINGSDATHTGQMTVAGQTLDNAVPTNSFGFVGWGSTGITSYVFRPSTTAPAANTVWLAGAPTSNIAALSFGKITSSYVDSSIALTGAAPTMSVANEGTTGTTANTLTKLTGAPSTALIAATTDTNGIVGITTAGAGITGSATIAYGGTVSCVFDGATTAGDYVQISSTTAGNCHDAGATYPTSGQVMGRVLSTNATGGTYTVDLFPPEIKASAGGGTTITGGGLALGPVQGGTLTGTAVGVANEVDVYKFVIQASIQITGISFYVNTLSAGQTCDVGLYNSSGNLVANTGPISAATTGAKDATITQTSVTLTPGAYWLAFGCTDTVAKLQAWNSSVMTSVVNAGGTFQGKAANALSTGSLPATLGTITGSTTPLPLIAWGHN